MKKEKSAAAGPECPETGDEQAPYSRGQATRDRILEAAKAVFSQHPYNAASIRMIAAQGGFEHGIIRYHFPSKARLFDAVVQEICKEIHGLNAQWLKEVASLPPRSGLGVYMDRLFAFNEEKPEVLRVIALNLPQDRNPGAIPGYGHIINMLASTRQSLTETLPAPAPGDMLLRFQDSFNALVLHYLGASSCQGRVLGLDPQGAEYKAWVKATMVALFAPLMESIVFGGRSGSAGGRTAP